VAGNGVGAWSGVGGDGVGEWVGKWVGGWVGGANTKVSEVTEKSRK
jgi:hypothetical protein